MNEKNRLTRSTRLNIGPARRRWLLRAVASLGTAFVPSAIRQALAKGENPAAPGLYRVEGDVRVNGKPAKEGVLVVPGDVIETGARSQAVFIVGRDAFMLRAGSRLDTTGKEMLINSLRIVTGKLLSVLGPGARRIETPSATIGIRGTGIYVEAEPDRSYVCTCYGVADLEPRDRPDLRETVTTRHHEQPRYIRSGSAMPVGDMMGKAPVINHTDAELVMLEALVGRRPPFLDSGAPPYSNPG
jgi:hypothetical protein